MLKRRNEEQVKSFRRFNWWVGFIILPILYLILVLLFGE